MNGRFWRYVLNANSGLERDVLDWDGLRSDLERHAARGDVLDYFMGSLGPRLAPDHFHYTKDVFKDRYEALKDHYLAIRGPRDRSVEADAALEASAFIVLYTLSLSWQN